MKFEEQKLGRYGKQLVAETLPGTIKIGALRKELHAAIDGLTGKDLNALHSHEGPAIVKISVRVRKHVETITQEGCSAMRAIEWLASGKTVFPATRIRGRERPELHFSPETIALMQKIDPFGWPVSTAEVEGSPPHFFHNYSSIAVVGTLLNEMLSRKRKFTLRMIEKATNLSYLPVSHAMRYFSALCGRMNENDEAKQQVGGELSLWHQQGTLKRPKYKYWTELKPLETTTHGG